MSDKTLQDQLDDLRRQFRLALFGYLLLAISIGFALWAISSGQSNQIRDDINTVARLGCYAGRVNVRKFNTFVDEVITTRKQSAAAHLEAGELAEAKNDQDAITRYQQTKLHVATDEECNRKILPPIQPPRRKEKA